MRRKAIPYGRQVIDDDDIRAVEEVMRSDWLTTGPCVDRFEAAFAESVGASRAVAVSSGTAALHCTMFAAGVGPGDEVIVPAMTFAATANCVVFRGARPVFADVEPGTLLIDNDDVKKKLTGKTRAVIAVDYCGQPCDYDGLQAVADERGLVLVADACHSLGAGYRGRKAGTLADLNAFSFHPVKHITTGEGGMVTTGDPVFADRMHSFRNHGFTTDHRQREERGTWYYEMVHLGYNYRITDMQCALGLSQLTKLPRWLARRREIAARYDGAFAGLRGVEPLDVKAGVVHAYHLYVVRLDPGEIGAGRREVFEAMRGRGIGVNVHYIPVHLHPFYRERFATGPGLCPVAEEAYERIISLPMHAGLSDGDVGEVIAALTAVAEGRGI